MSRGGPFRSRRPDPSVHTPHSGLSVVKRAKMKVFARDRRVFRAADASLLPSPQARLDNPGSDDGSST